MEPHVYVTKDPMTVEITNESTVVDIEGGFRPIVTVVYGGGRGPIWLPGNTYTGDTLADILTGYITKGQLSNDLKEEIERSTTGLDEAALALEQAILGNNSAINAVYSRIEDAEDSISLSAGRLLTAENDISTVKLDITDAMFRVSAAEGDITDLSDFKVAQETLLKNEWTVKIQENTDGTSCVAGIGLLMYPNWEVNSLYELDDYVWFDDGAYKAKTTHTALTENTPPNSTYWEYIPYATKSQFGVLADSFFIQTTSGDKTVPFMVQNDKVIINGDLLVDQLITSSIMSTNYIPGISGYSLNASTGEAEFNNITLTITYNDLSGIPTSLADIDSSAASKLSGISSGATVGANWGVDINNQPADEDILNSMLDLSNFVTVTSLAQIIEEIESGSSDSQYVTWYYPGVPTLTNNPAINWTDSTIKSLHLGDVYHDELTGRAYQFKLVGSTYSWVLMANEAVADALAAAANARDTADNKRRVFTNTPFGPYDVGDLWTQNGAIRFASIARETGYTASDWTLTSDVTANNTAYDVATIYGYSASTIASYANDPAARINSNSTTISGGRISTGTIYTCTLSTAYSGRRVEISHSTNDIKVYNSSGSQIVTVGENASGGFISSITGNYTLPAIYGESNGSVCVMGSCWGSANAVVGYAHKSNYAGVEGCNWATGSKGIIGYSAWDFYACGSGTNYGAFTGGHDALLVKGEHIPIGYIVEDVLCINKRNISSTIFTLAKSTLASRPIGVIATIARPLTYTEYASGLIDSYDQDNLPLFIDGYTTLCETYNLITFNAVGEGQVYVCGENGDMVNGDLICCSSIPGIGMKQLDDIVRNTTVAKVRGAVSFTDTTTIQLVPCIYLCG